MYDASCWVTSWQGSRVVAAALGLEDGVSDWGAEEDEPDPGPGPEPARAVWDEEGVGSAEGWSLLPQAVRATSRTAVAAIIGTGFIGGSSSFVESVE